MIIFTHCIRFTFDSAKIIIFKRFNFNKIIWKGKQSAVETFIE